MFTRSGFDGFARQHPDLEHKLLQRTLTELDRARHWMLLLGRKTATERIASFLLEMSARLAETGCHGAPEPAAAFELPLDRQQIADVLGLTIETVSRQFTRLRTAGLIELPERRSVVIRDRAGLESLAEAG
jgi:CRP/FNR family transcriptional regulator